MKQASRQPGSAAEPDIHCEASVGEGVAGTGDRFDLVAHRGGKDEQAIVHRLDLDRLVAAQVEHAQPPAGEAAWPTVEVIAHRQATPATGRIFVAGVGVGVRAIEGAIAVRHHLDPLIIKIIVAKLIFDISLHAYAIVLYQRWLGIPLSRKLWVQSLGATLAEPFVFQIMRQLGAVMGWLAFLRRKIDWMPQRRVITAASSPATS